jgi:hypothetical protein
VVQRLDQQNGGLSCGQAIGAGLAAAWRRAANHELFCAKIMPKLGAGTLFLPPPPRTEDLQIAYLYIETNMHLFGSSSSIYHNFQILKRRGIDEVI